MVGFVLIGLFIILLMYKEICFVDSIYSGYLFDLCCFILIISIFLFLFYSLICLVIMLVILVFVILVFGWFIIELGGSVSDFIFWFICNVVLSIVVSFIMLLYIKC